MADGRLLAVTANHVVVEQCSTPFDCELVWLERQSWKPDTSIIAPTINNSSYLWGMGASPDGKWVFVPDFQTGQAIVWNLQNGEVQSDVFVQSVSFSPDSRYASGLLRNGHLGVIDLETGELAQWDESGINAVGASLFVPAG